jgi:hypothetical protein
VVHEGNARGSHLGLGVGSTGDERLYSIRTFSKKLVEGLLANWPSVGFKVF